MRASNSKNPSSRRALGHVAALLVVAASLLAVGDGCDGGREGERCNPLLSHDECDKGLSCQRPSTCAENYCCPDPASSSSNPFCNGLACPVPEGGSDDGGDAETPPESGAPEASPDGGAARD